MNMQLPKRVILDRWAQPISSVSPFAEIGVSGTAVFGGFIAQKERSSKLYGQERYRTASDMLGNISIVAAGVRYFLNLLARPEWKVDSDDDDESKSDAEWVEEVMNDMETPWARMIRRSGMYRFHGFGIQEWVAKKRKDGKIGLRDIESRPQHTINRWQVDDKGTVTGVWQTSPQTGQEIGLPRSKIIYLLDDTLTDSPEGMGWFRHLVDPAERLKVYLQLEGYGFQRDLNGTPIGRAPLSKINQLVAQQKITQAQADTLIDGMRSFVRMQAKSPDTGMVIDSQPFESMTADGFSVSSTPQWGLELLQATAGALPQMGEAISRLTYDMARIIGVENLLTGSEGTGSLALSKDKSRNIYLTVNSTLHDMAAQFSKDVLDPLWALNGLPEEKKPRFTTEDVSFKDVEQISAVLRDMATAGAVLQPDDPAIDDVRDLMGISRQPEMDEDMLGMMRRQSAGLPPDPNELDPETGEDIDPKTGKVKPRAFNKGFDPNQPRDPKGTETGGEWTDGGASGSVGEGYKKLKDQTQEEYDAYESKMSVAGELSQEERNEVNGYAGTADKLNVLLRYGTDRNGKPYPEQRVPGGPSERTRGEWEKVIKTMDAAMAKSATTENLTVFRGLKIDPADADKMFKVGETYTDKGFVSTSSSKKTSRWFAKGPDGLEVVIKVPKGSSALHMSTHSKVFAASMGEQEFLLPRNSSFKVDRIETVGKNKKRVVHMTLKK